MRSRIPLPSFADIFVAAAVVWLLAASGPGSEAGLLQDGDTGVHIRTGLLILDTGRIPSADPYSWTRPGAPWIAWEWLSDVIFALLYRAGGVAAVIGGCAAVIGALTAVLLRRIASGAANALVALVLTSVAMGVTQIHLLARPHVFTLLFLALSTWWLDKDDREGTKRTLWLLPLLTALWVNLHGGVFALFGVLGILCVGAALESRWEVAKRLALTSILCALATFATPFGLQLHAHVFEYLTADWIREDVAEFRPVDLRSATGLWLQAVLFTGLIAVANDLRERRFSRVLLVAAWGHLALTSGRHIPLFIIVAAPAIAEAAGKAWHAIAKHPFAQPLDAIGADHLPGLRRFTAWGAILPALAMAAMPVARDYPAAKFPVEIVRTQAASLAGTRLFTTDEWADYIVFHLHPEARVFLDGRSDFFGRAIVDDYKRVLAASPGWQNILARYDTDAVLMPRDSAVASALGVSPEWRVAAEAGGAVLIRRR